MEETAGIKGPFNWKGISTEDSAIEMIMVFVATLEVLMQIILIIEHRHKCCSMWLLSEGSTCTMEIFFLRDNINI